MNTTTPPPTHSTKKLLNDDCRCKKAFITVFTPTFNRAYILPKLYESLMGQTCKDFEWIIVDDGSTDNTQELCKQWEREGFLDMKYICVQNGGKHRAINKGLKEARGELFFVVDSDDSLAFNAISIIYEEWKTIEQRKNEFAGLSGLRFFESGEKVGGEEDWERIECSPLEFRYKYCAKGDMAEVIRTEVFREYPFPEIENEKFCPEALFFNRISRKYKILYFYKKIYLCDYQPDGLTASIVAIRMHSPTTSCIYYNELVNIAVPFKIKVKSAINYWRFWFCHSKNKKPSISPLWWWTMPLGFMMHINDIRKQ